MLEAVRLCGEPSLHGLVMWLEEQGQACVESALLTLSMLEAEGGEPAEGGGDLDNGDEDEGDNSEDDEDDEVLATLGGGDKPGFAHMTLRELEAIPRRMIKEGGRYVDPVEQLERDKEQWRRERKAIKEDRRLARIAKERAKQQRASRKEAGDLPGQVAAAEVEAMAAEEEAARDAADAEEERRAAAEAARAEARWAVELERTAPGASDRLARGLEEWCSSQAPATVKMRQQRERLPAWESRAKIAEAVRSSRVVVIAGETGCGKTTQVPQFILDDAIQRGEGGRVSIICTQPRRISATSVAQRVAAERGEQIGGTVGYQIRLEKKGGAATRVMFCTIGILLRRLIDDPTLVGCTHVIVDEVHERSLDSDFLLVLLRRLLAQKPSLKIVLMSATLNADAFSSYFGGGPVITIPGFTHPVKELYLEDVVQLTAYALPPGSEFQRQRAPAQNTEEMAAIAKLLQQGYSANTVATLRRMDPDKINYELLTAVVAWICKSGGPGAVLIFMPGLMEITALHTALSANPVIKAATRNGAFLIAMHSALSSAQQNAAFSIPPDGVRKIVVATNIAETSITIEDCTFVVDTGRVKENSYSPATHICCLLERWTSRASAKQRRGRAGRVAPGTCLRLFTRWAHEHVLEAYQEPEIMRVPLEGLCLQIKMLRFPGGVEGFLGSAMQSPDRAALSAALQALKARADVGALDHAENLTPLGRHLAVLPVDARVGKMLLIAAIMGCLDPVLTVAAAMSSRSPFVAPLEKREEADLAKRSFADCNSDHLAVMQVYQEWLSARSAGRGAERTFCRDSFVSGRALEEISDLRQQFRSLLYDVGFMGAGRGRGGGGRGGRASRGRGGGGHTRAVDAEDAANAHAANRNLVLAVICAGLYPNAVRVAGNAGGGSGGKSSGKEPPKLFARSATRPGDEPVAIHPSSVSFGVTKFPSRWLVYLEKVKTSAVYLRDASPATPYSLLLFGGDVQVQHTAGTVTIDRWATLRCQPRTGALFRMLRDRLDALLDDKIQNPKVDVWTLGGPLIRAIVQLLSSEKALSG
eukprot:jgi/Tetstr1/434289/TSEL_023396.t1